MLEITGFYMDLGRDKINEELSVGSKRVGIGIG